MDFTTILGIVAGFLTTLSYLPQVIKIWSTKSTKDISLGMFSILSLGIFFWLIYGLLIRDLPLILANSVTFAFTLAILFFKLRYK